MRMIMAFLSFTFTIMFIMFAYELAKFLKTQLQSFVKFIVHRKRRKKASLKDFEEIVRNEVNDDDYIGEVSSDV